MGPVSPELDTFLSRLQRFALSERPDEASVIQAYRDYVAACDLPIFVIGCMTTLEDGTPDITAMWSNMSEAWLEEYHSCHYDAHDYVLLAAAQRKSPEVSMGLTWSGRTAERRDVTPETSVVLRGAADAGLMSAVSFWGRTEQFADGGNRTFGFSIGAPDVSEEQVEKLFRARHNELLIATFAMLPVLRPALERGKQDFHRNLTVRETDVLGLFAQGMRPDRIADAMGIAKVTVDLHAVNARRKLSAQTMPEAVAKAIRYGLI